MVNAVTSKTQIANLALSNLRQSTTVENIDTEVSKAAKEAKKWYDTARLHALAQADWSFARKRQALASHSVDAPTSWSFRYQYPVDCVAPRFIENPSGDQQPPVPFEMEDAGDGTTSIVTDEDDAVLVYTRNVSTVSLFSPQFVTALSLLLAHFMAGTITGKTTLKQEMADAYASAVASASAVDGNTQIQRQPRDADWIDGR